MITVALIDDHLIVRSGFAQLLGLEPDLQVVAAFSASAGGVWPSLSSNRRLLYQSTHVSVASSTSARFFQLLRCITSAL